MLGIIYCWVNKDSGKCYIGSTTNHFNRMMKHVNASSNLGLREDMEKKGVTGFMYSVLEFIEFPDFFTKGEIRKILWDKEQYYIEKHLVVGGNLAEHAYNKVVSVWGIGRKFSEEEKKKMSTSGLGKILSSTHIENIKKNHASKKGGYVGPNKGKKMSENSRKAIDKWLNGVKKKILQYDIHGKFIKEYESISTAAKENKCLTSNISKVVSGKSRSYKGYIWKPYEINYPLVISLPKIQYLLVFDESLNPVGRYINKHRIHKELGVGRKEIDSCIQSGKSSKGYFIQYET